MYVLLAVTGRNERGGCVFSRPLVEERSVCVQWRKKGRNKLRQRQLIANPPTRRAPHSGEEREGDEHEVALSEAAILRLMA